MSLLYRWIRTWWPILMMATALIAVVSRHGFSREIARWHIAKALEQRSQGDLLGALQSLDRAADWDPNATDAYYDALNRAWTVAILRNPLSHTAYMERALARPAERQDPKQVEAALADAKEALRLVRIHQSEALNALAYVEGLNNRELEEALQSINLALKIDEKNRAMLDTRAVVQYQRKAFALARNDLDEAIKQSEQHLAELKESLTEPNLNIVRKGMVEAQLKAAESAHAVYLYHRSKVLDALDLNAEAEADRQQIRGLGVEPSEHLF